MPTTIDTFWAILNITRVLSDRHRNMRQNVVQIQRWYHGTDVTTPSSPLLNNLPATQQAVRDFGNATVTILNVVLNVYNTFPTQITAAATAPLPTFNDLQNSYNLLQTWANNMATATFNTAADLDNGVAALLAAVPDTMLPY